MPFPAITHCLLCEDVRLERRRMSTLVGFYGAVPNVGILVKKFGEPLERLMFVFLSGPGEGEYAVSAEVRDTQGVRLAPPQPPPSHRVTLSLQSAATQVAIGFQNIRFPQPGKYTIVLLVDGGEHYHSEFKVSAGQPEDFT